MRTFGSLLILLSCFAFAVVFLDLDGGPQEDAALALLATALMVSGSVFSGVAALAHRLQREPAGAMARPELAEPAAAVEAPQPAIRRPGFHRRAA